MFVNNWVTITNGSSVSVLGFNLPITFPYLEIRNSFIFKTWRITFLPLKYEFPTRGPTGRIMRLAATFVN